MCYHHDWPTFFIKMFYCQYLSSIEVKETVGHPSKLGIPVEYYSWLWGWCWSLALMVFWCWFLGRVWNVFAFLLITWEVWRNWMIWLLYFFMGQMWWHLCHVDPFHFKSLPSGESALQSRDLGLQMLEVNFFLM